MGLRGKAEQSKYVSIEQIESKEEEEEEEEARNIERKKRGIGLFQCQSSVRG